MPDVNPAATAVVETTPPAGGGETPTTEIETPTPGEGETPAGEEGGEPGEGEPAEGETPEFDEPEEFRADGRKVDSKTRNAIATLSKTDKESARILRDLYFRTEAIVKDLGAKNMHEAQQIARQNRATIDALGGDEGINAMQSEVSDYRNEIRSFANGDRGLIEQLYDSNKEALGTAGDNVLAVLQERSPEIWEKTVMPHVVARLDKAGLPGVVDRLLDMIKEGKGQEAYDLTAQVKKWLTDAKSLVDKNAETRKKADPREEEYAERERKLNERDAQSYDRDISVDLNRMSNVSLAKVVSPFVKEIGLSQGGSREFVGVLQKRIWATMREDRTFQRNAHALKDKGDAAETAKFIHSKFSELLPEHFRKLRNEMYPNYKPKPKPKDGSTNGKPAAGGKPGVTVSSLAGKKPNREDVDWTKTSQTMWITGRAVLKNGKDHKWDWKTA